MRNGWVRASTAGAMLMAGMAQATAAGQPTVDELMTNASRTQPARILVFMIKEKRRPASRTVAPEGAP